MPKLFEVRLEAPDGSGFRLVRTQAEDAETAKKIAYRLELSNVLFELSAEQEAELLKTYKAKSLDELPDYRDDRQAFRRLAVPDRARLNAHRQTEPFEIVSVKEVSK